MKRMLIALVAVGGLVGGLLSAQAAVAAVPTGIKGSAEGAIRETAYRAGEPSGPYHIDTPAMISRIEALHDNTYDFLIEAPSDWADFSTEFMPAAQAAGIQVIAYLVPPTECPGGGGTSSDSCTNYTPNHRDYVAWGRSIATLAATYPDLIGWTIDDMDAASNLSSLFTAAYVKSMNQAAQAIAPGLNFFLQVYQPTITQSLIDSYAAGIAGVIMPFRDGSYRNTTWTQSFQSAVTSFTAMTNHDSKKLIVMVYGNSLSRTDVAIDTDYVASVVSQALTDTASQQIAGVIIWNLALSPTGRPATNAANLADSGNGALVLSVAASTATSAGQYAQASTTIHLNTGSTSCTMVLHRNDSRDTTAPGGFHQKQAYVGGHLVWETDVNYDGTAWYSSSPIDITSDLTGGSGTLVLRLAEIAGVSNYQVTVAFDDIALTGCSISNPTFETDSGWTISRSGGPVLASIYQYSPTYTTDTFDRVAALYGT
jgi:hypothetical protein